MSKNVNVNGVDYSGVSQVQLNTADGGTALFKDVDEITTPSGTVNIAENGTYDVSAYASADVNVSGGSAGGENTYEMGQFTIEETCRLYTYEHSMGRVPKFVIVYPISVAQTDQTYAISVETIINGLGQADYDISGKSQWLSAPTPFVNWVGSGYQATVQSGGSGTASPGTTAYDAAELTDTYVKVGSFNTQVNVSGFLVAGTYGIIVG